MATDRSHRRLSDFEPIDRITIEVIPRYKTSGMSGDEWRQHIQVDGFFKGLKVFEMRAGGMDTALSLLPGAVLHWRDDGLAKGLLEREKECCDQPSCQKTPVAELTPKRLTSRTGDYLDPAEQYFTYYRSFCEEHSRRGDCSREDADSNYERHTL